MPFEHSMERVKSGPKTPLTNDCSGRHRGMHYLITCPDFIRSMEGSNSVEYVEELHTTTDIVKTEYTTACGEA